MVRIVMFGREAKFKVHAIGIFIIVIYFHFDDILVFNSVDDVGGLHFFHNIFCFSLTLVLDVLPCTIRRDVSIEKQIFL